MKDFLKGYKEARAKAREYMRAKRAGWVEPGKRTTENHAILVPRREAMEMAEELATNIYARELYTDWAMELRGFMERLAREVDDTLVCGKCGGVFRREWGANCPYCRAKENAEKYVNALREAARE